MAQARGLLRVNQVVLPSWLSSTKVSLLIERLSNPKDLKKRLRTHNNVFVLYSGSEVAAESHLKLLSTVAQAVKGQGTICWVDCGYVLGTQGTLAGVCLGPLVTGAEARV